MYNRKKYENDVNRDAISDFKTKQPIPHKINVKYAHTKIILEIITNLLVIEQFDQCFAEYSLA